ncbi:MAG: M56 family metallopeptidase [Sphingomonadales bacterium]|jgi:beta-lactamase regulating signal transducer with metallopeptidase domain
MSMLPSPAWLAEALIGTTLLMLLVLLVRRPVARLWGAHHAYALWALPAVRMVLPAIPGWQSLLVPVANARPDGAAAVALMPPADAALYTQPLPPVSVQMGPHLNVTPDWPAALLGLWALGAALFLAVQWARHVRFVGKAVAEGSHLATIAGVDVFVSSHVPGPMAAGIWRRRILLPADFLFRYAPAERRLALQHEAAHHDRFDLAANFAGLLVLAAHWWNPIAHAAWRAFRADQELACDATVLAGSDGDTRAAYGQAVLKSACVATPIAACAMNHKHQLKDRIAMMKDRKLGIARRLLGVIAVAGVASAALAATASGAPPAPPVPPAPPAPINPPAPTAAPQAPQAKVMVFKLRKDGKVEDGTPMTMVIKDGVTMVDGKTLAEPPVPPGTAPGVVVQVTQSADGKRFVMVRRVAGAPGADPAAIDKLAEQRIADIKARMRTRCEGDGVKLPADADFDQLATCGMDMQKQVRDAMASARKAVEESKSLSAAERENALKGIDQALATMRREVIVKIEK